MSRFRFCDSLYRRTQMQNYKIFGGTMLNILKNAYICTSDKLIKDTGNEIFKPDLMA